MQTPPQNHLEVDSFSEALLGFRLTFSEALFVLETRQGEQHFQLPVLSEFKPWLSP
jgi:hypothetical protein